MPFDPKTSNIIADFGLRDILDTALERRDGVYLPVSDNSAGHALRLKLGRFRAAAYEQLDEDVSGRYRALTFRVGESNAGVITLWVGVVPQSEYTMIDAETGKEIDNVTGELKDAS